VQNITAADGDEYLPIAQLVHEAEPEVDDFPSEQSEQDEAP
jgi:hypothetical protein